MTLREITDKIYCMEDKEKKMAANEVYYQAADWIRESWPERYAALVEMAEDVLYKIDYKWARETVRKMKPSGECWSLDAVKDYIQDKPISCDPIEMYMCMNMAYNDYRDVADRMGIDVTEFCYMVARRFIEDDDAPPHKVAKYFSMK